MRLWVFLVGTVSQADLRWPDTAEHNAPRLGCEKDLRSGRSSLSSARETNTTPRGLAVANGSFLPPSATVRQNLYRVRPDGTGLEQLTNHPAYDDQAAFSPDGKQSRLLSALALAAGRISGSLI